MISGDNGIDDDNSTVDSSGLHKKGLMHTLIHLAKDRKISTVYEMTNNDLIFEYIKKVLSNVVRKNKWNKYSKKHLMKDFVDKSDDSFGMLVLENNAEKWLQELEYKGRPIMKKDMVKSLYTEKERKREWSVEGIKRFRELTVLVLVSKRKLGERYQEIEDTMRTMEIQYDTTNNRKRKCIEFSKGKDGTKEEFIHSVDGLSDFLLGHIDEETMIATYQKEIESSNEQNTRTLSNSYDHNTVMNQVYENDMDSNHNEEGNGGRAHKKSRQASGDIDAESNDQLEGVQM